jgi:hypothetical protein
VYHLWVLVAVYMGTSGSVYGYQHGAWWLQSIQRLVCLQANFDTRSRRCSLLKSFGESASHKVCGAVSRASAADVCIASADRAVLLFRSDVADTYIGRYSALVCAMASRAPTVRDASSGVNSNPRACNSMPACDTDGATLIASIAHKVYTDK